MKRKFQVPLALAMGTFFVCNLMKKKAVGKMSFV